MVLTRGCSAGNSTDAPRAAAAASSVAEHAAPGLKLGVLLIDGSVGCMGGIDKSSDVGSTGNDGAPAGRKVGGAADVWMLALAATHSVTGCPLAGSTACVPSDVAACECVSP